MIPQMRASFLNLDLAKYYERSSGSSSSKKPSVDEYEDVEIDFSTFPFYFQLLDMGFEATLINKAFHKFVEPSDTSDTEVNSRAQESMILWLFEEQERQQSLVYSDNSSLVTFDNSDGIVMGSLFDNNIPVVDESVTSQISTSSKKTIKKKKAKKQKQPNLLFVMQKLFSYMAKIEKPSIETVELTDAFGWKSRHVSMQHDIQELSRVFFQALETKLSKMKIDNFIKNTCAGKIVNKIVCQACGNISCIEEDFYDLTVTVENSLKESLEKYTEVERFEGNNKYHCSNCQKCVDLALRSTTIRQLPPILFFSLTRFSYDWNTESRIKVKKEMTFEATLDMTPFTENPSTYNREEYELVSVIIHSGSPYAGHYYCFARDFLGEGKTTIENEESRKNEKQNKKKSSRFEVSDDQHWFEFNDERVYQIDPKEEIPKYFGGKGASAYMLVYKKKSLTETFINFSLPSYFEQEIEKENEHIQILREYQTQQHDMSRQANTEKQNTGSALVYLPRFFSVDNSSLVASNFDEIGKLYRTFSFHYDTSVNEFYQLVKEKFADSFDNVTLYIMEKDGNKYTVGSELPRHADDDEILIRQYCKQDTKYLYILVDSFATPTAADTRFQIQNPTSSTEITLYETFCDTKIVRLDFTVSSTLRELIEQAKQRFSCEIPLRVFFNYSNGKPKRVSNLDTKMLYHLNGFTSISLEYESNDVSYVEMLYEEAQELAQVTKNQNIDSSNKSDEDRGDLVIVKFADREKLIHIDLSSTLFALKKKILHEMFSSKSKIFDKLSSEGDAWIRKCVLVRKQKKSFFEENNNDSPLTKLDIGDGDRLDVVIHLQSEKDVEIQFIEIVPQDPIYEEQTNEKIAFDTRNSFVMKLEQDITLKQW